MSITKGLTCLGMLSGRGLDNGEEGAVMLANQVYTSINILVTSHVYEGLYCHVWYWGETEGILEIRGEEEVWEEEQAEDDIQIKLPDWKRNFRFQMDNNQGMYDEFEKLQMIKNIEVREEICLAHEAYQFFRYKYKKRYGEYVPGPNKFWYILVSIVYVYLLFVKFLLHCITVL